MDELWRAWRELQASEEQTGHEGKGWRVWTRDEGDDVVMGLEVRFVNVEDEEDEHGSRRIVLEVPAGGFRG